MMNSLGDNRLPERGARFRCCARRVALFVSLSASLCLAACRQKPAKQPTMQMGWRPIASWSGHGNIQTEEFETHTGQFRIKWATSNEEAPGKGKFKLILHSSVSGRWVADAADVTGIASGVSYQAEEPRQFFLVVESTGCDWNVSVQEGEMGEVE